jgi:hypothetical protein
MCSRTVVPKSSVRLRVFVGKITQCKGIFTNKSFVFTVGSVCRVKRFTTGSRYSLQDVRMSQMMPDQVALLRLRQKQLCKRVVELIRADRRITIDSVATELACSHGLAYSLMHNRLKFRNVCAWWVPGELKKRKN